ncbi:DUF3089 domain-containing protein [Desulfoplanes sp.]
MKKVLPLIPCRVLALVAFAILLCYPGTGKTELSKFTPEDIPTRPDYSQSANWLALPDVPDQYSVDVFWVYPTVNTGDKGWLMDVTDDQMCAKAQKTLTTQASVFSIQANLYAPLYRQMNLAGLSLPEKEKNIIISHGKDDVWRALKYYLDNSNGGKPFILAGHSQGSNILADLMTEHWGALGVEKRLVAAYLIGWSVTPEDLRTNPSLEICHLPGQTECIVTYNTVAAGKQKKAPTIIPGTYVVNPLTWTTTDKPGPATMNMGSAFFQDDGTIVIRPGFTSARIKDCGLVVVPKDGSLLASPLSAFPQGVYHPFDYALFYRNIMANAAERIQAAVSQ